MERLNNPETFALVMEHLGPQIFCFVALISNLDTEIREARRNPERNQVRLPELYRRKRAAIAEASELISNFLLSRLNQ